MPTLSIMRFAVASTLSYTRPQLHVKKLKNVLYKNKHMLFELKGSQSNC